MTYVSILKTNNKLKHIESQVYADKYIVYYYKYVVDFLSNQTIIPPPITLSPS